MTGQADYSKLDFGFTMEVTWETDVKWLYDLFAKAYKLVSYPIFTVSYAVALNRYDYLATVSPEPYDSHLWTMKLSMDIHKNVRGGLSSRLALEQYRDRNTSEVTREIFSYEVGFNFTLVF